MATYYSGWVGGDDWRIRVDVDASSPAMSTTGTVSVHVACENRYMTYSAGAQVSISCAGQTRTVTTSGVHGAGTYWAATQTFTVGRGHGTTGVGISVAMSAPSSATAAYRAGTSMTCSISLDAVTHNVISYDGNGGTANGATTQTTTKWYGEHYYVPTYAMARDGYSFLGWAESSTATSATKRAGDEETRDQALTFWAVWKRSYLPPTIGSLTAARSDSAGNALDEGTYARVVCEWAVDTTVSAANAVSKVTCAWRKLGDSTWSDEVELTAGGTTSGSATGVVGTMDEGYAYDVRVTVTDPGGSAVATTVVGPTRCLLDLLKGGRGIAIGKYATEEGLDVAMAMRCYGVPMLPVLYYESKPAESALPVKPCLVAVKGGGLYLAE
ncbi:MAG: InlB B-repeat-containing protein [Atopobiaceae bacterium]